jgi:hypothetical protein
MNELKLPGLNKNTINETQNFMEKKVTFKQVRDNFGLQLVAQNLIFLYI